MKACHNPDMRPFHTAFYAVWLSEAKEKQVKSSMERAHGVTPNFENYRKEHKNEK